MASTKPTQGDPRERMVRSAAALIGTQGMNATSFSDVLADSGAPRGSIYHHFPDGKRQLAADAVAWTAEQVVSRLQASTPATPADVVGNFVALFRSVFLASGGTAGCAVAGVTIDVGAGDEDLRATADRAFRSWTHLLTEQFASVGLARPRAAAAATATVAAVEGALILSRAEGSDGPLDTVAAQLTALVEG
jgi:AcrR family transcriptional regulator